MEGLLSGHAHELGAVAQNLTITCQTVWKFDFYTVVTNLIRYTVCIFQTYKQWILSLEDLEIIQSNYHVAYRYALIPQNRLEALIDI
jgi:hypothetical protein